MDIHEKKVILLVEDEPIIAIAEKRSLEKEGYSVLLAENGETAVREAASNKNLDLILMDINLGTGIDGTEAAERILKMREIPLVFLSSHTEKDIVKRTEGITFYGYILKNSGETVLHASIKMAFRLHQAKLQERESRELQRLMVNIASTYIALPLDQLEEEIERSLSAIAGAIKADRAYIFSYRLEEGIAVNTHEWCAEGIKGQKENLQAVPLSTIKEGADLHQEGRVHLISDVDVLASPDLKALLKDQGIRSMLTVPMILEGHCIGCVGFDSVNRKYHYSEKEIHLLTIFAHMLADAAHHKRIEKQLQDERDVLNALFSSMPTGILLIDCEGGLLKVNEKFTDISGYSKDDLQSLEEWLTLSIPDRKLRENICRACMGAKENTIPVSSRSFSLNCRNGTSKDVEIRMSFLEDGRRIVTLDDISDRKQIERSLYESDRRYQKLFETMAQGVVYQDAKGTIIAANPAAEEILGLSLEEMKGKTSDNEEWHSVDSEGNPVRGDRHPAMKALATGRKIENEVMGVYNQKEHSYRWLSISAIPEYRAEENRPYQVYATFSDITARKISEDRVRQELREKQTVLKEVHHRVKNNIAAAEALLSLHMDTVKNMEAANILKEAAGRLASVRILYEKLLADQVYSSISSKVYLEALMDTIMQIFPGPTRIEAKYDLQDFPVPSRYIFPIGSIVNEIVTNSLKYAFKGREQGEIELVFRKEGEHILLVIGDNGSGLPDEVDPENPESFGFKLIKLFVEQLQGEMTIENSKGCKFRISFKEEKEQS
jgi:PAS domain S-box-containing protein